MKTSQSFPFYPTDFLMGTALMTAEEVGAYIRLLCYQWQEGGLPKEQNLLARLAQTNLENIAAISDKFREGSDGKLRNKKMEEVRKSLILYKKSRSDNGKKGGRPPKAHGNHMVSLCLNGENHSESLPSPSPSPSPLPIPSPGKKPESPAATVLPFQSEEFGAAWGEWKTHRSEIKKPIKPTQEAAQLAALKEVGEARAIAMIRYTIQMGWQGLREQEQPRGTKPKHTAFQQSDTTAGKTIEQQLNF